MKIALCSDDFFTPIQDVIRDSGHEVTHVFSSQNLDHTWTLRTAQFAKDMRANFTTKPITSEDFIDFTDRNLDLLLVAGYNHKIPIPDASTLKCANIHPSLLPEGRGSWVIPEILLNFPNIAGTTIHSMTNKLDLGDILLQERIDVNEDDNYDSLVSKVLISAKHLTSRLLKELDQLWKSKLPMIGNGSYLGKPTDAQRTISPDDNLSRIANIYRAFGTYTLFENPITGNKDTLKRISLLPSSHTEQNGTLILNNKDRIIFAVNGGYLVVFPTEPE